MVIYSRRGAGPKNLRCRHQTAHTLQERRHGTTRFEGSSALSCEVHLSRPSQRLDEQGISLRSAIVLRASRHAQQVAMTDFGRTWTRSIDLAEIWRRLLDGEIRLVRVRCIQDRCFATLEERHPRGAPLSEAIISVLERLLIGDALKVIASKRMSNCLP